MKEKMFTTDEANRTLPLVRTIVRDILEDHRAIDELKEDARKESRRLKRFKIDEIEASSGRTRAIRKTEAEVAAQLSAHRQELETLGCRLEDVGLGAVAFPAMLDDEVVYLSWQWNEERIAHFHKVKESHVRRRPLPQEVRNRAPAAGAAAWTSVP